MAGVNQAIGNVRKRLRCARFALSSLLSANKTNKHPIIENRDRLHGTPPPAVFSFSMLEIGAKIDSSIQRR